MNNHGDGVLRKDTVTADEEDDKVNAHHHVGEDGPSVRHDAVVHHSVPVLPGEDLHTDVQTHRRVGRQTDREAGRRSRMQKNSQTERHTDRHEERKTESPQKEEKKERKKENNE